MKQQREEAKKVLYKEGVMAKFNGSSFLSNCYIAECSLGTLYFLIPLDESTDSMHAREEIKAAHLIRWMH